MTSTELTDKLIGFLDNTDDSLDADIAHIRTFEDAGIRYNDGIVLVMADGTEFQVTIVRSK